MGGTAALVDGHGRRLSGLDSCLLPAVCVRSVGSGPDVLLPAAHRAVCCSRVLPDVAAGRPPAVRLARRPRPRVCPCRSARFPDCSRTSPDLPLTSAGSTGGVGGAAVRGTRAAWPPSVFLNPRPFLRRFVCYGLSNSGKHLENTFNSGGPRGGPDLRRRVRLRRPGGARGQARICQSGCGESCCGPARCPVLLRGRRLLQSWQMLRDAWLLRG